MEAAAREATGGLQGQDSGAAGAGAIEGVSAVGEVLGADVEAGGGGLGGGGGARRVRTARNADGCVAMQWGPIPVWARGYLLAAGEGGLTLRWEGGERHEGRARKEWDFAGRMRTCHHRR